MNLLVITPNLPSPTWGASNRNFQLLKALTRQHTVSLIAIVDADETERSSDIEGLETLVRHLGIVRRPAERPKRMQQMLNALRGQSHTLEMNTFAEVQKRLDLLFAAQSYDMIIFESVLTAGYRIPQSVRVVIDQHNIESELLQRTYQQEKSWLRKWYNWNEFRLLRPVEFERCRHAHGVVVTSEREQMLLQKLVPNSQVAVVSNGVDTELFHPSQVQAEQPEHLIFTGTMCYYPNIDAVLSFARHCWPLIQAQRPQVTWQIVGNAPPPEVQQLSKLPGVSVTGAVPDIQPYLSQATLALVPIRIGSGTRLKILEALAMEKAVVTTSQGCEGLNVQSDQHLLIADEPQAFAQAVIRLLESKEQRRALGRAGRKLIEREYSWQRSGERMLEAVESFSSSLV